MSLSSNNISEQLTKLIPRLRRYALVLTHSKPNADDLLQATLERALTKQQQWKENTHLDRWVFTIMSSIWKNDIRRESVRRGNGINYEVDELTDNTNELKRERTFLYQQVFKEVMALSENQREAIFLIYIEGIKYQEAADILEIPVGTLMSRLARARIILAKKFSDPSEQANVIKLDERRV